MSSSTFGMKNYRVYNKQTLLKLSDLEPLICRSCGGILQDPVQVTACGDRFCRSCIENIMSHSEGPYKCPVDNEEFVRSQVRKDRGCLKELQGLEIECTTQPTPCNWKGPLTVLEDHLARCPNIPVDCTLGCGKQLLKSQLTKHITNHCSKRPSECHHCKKSVPYHSLEDHYQSCEEVPTDCDYCKKNLPSRKQLERHLESECEEYQIICPMHSTINCDFQDKRPQMSQHMQSHMIQMAELLTKALGKIETLEAKVESLTESQRQSEKKVEVLTERLEKVEMENEKKGDIVVKLEERIKSLKHSTSSPKLLAIPHAVERDCAVTPVSNGRSLTYDEPSSLYSTTRHAPSSLALKSLSGTPYQSRSTEADVSRMKQEMDTHQTQLLKITENLQTVQHSLTQHAVAIDEVRLRQDMLDVKTTNGVFIWKIPDIRRRFRDAMDGRTISLYSPPFFTSPHGYRMCVRTYLNGDGIGKGTHMSVFFVLMRSEHDNLLSYPFKQSVRFTLINQVNPTESISEAFIPDLSSPSFQRPEKDMNVASGFPKFARQSILHDDKFTKGNVIYIKCQVDLSGLTPQ